jgi:FAD synthase
MKPVTLTGRVTKFRGNGRHLGYPTANIRSDTNLDEGVYFGFADLTTYHNYPALVFIGVPTTMGDTERRVEVHVLDIPDIDYYGQTIRVRIEHFYRRNKRFESVEELITVMRVDEAQARSWFAKNSNVSDT